MHKLLYFLLFIPFYGQAQDTNKIQAKALYKKTIPLYNNYVLLKYKNPDSAKIILKRLIENYNEIYKLDTANSKIVNYLIEAYFDDDNNNKTIDWCNYQIKRQSDSENVVNYGILARVYFRMGNIAKGKSYIKKAIPLDNVDPNAYDITPTLLLNLKVFIDSVFVGNNRNEIMYLKSKNISPVPYSIDVFKFLYPYAKRGMMGVKEQFEADPIYGQIN